MRFGLFVPQGWRMDLIEIDDPIEQYEAMTAVAKVADEGPWDSIWVYDHFHTVPKPTDNTTFEAWTATATLVRDTKRVNVGQMVTCNGYRNPSLWAKIASTVDVASHGRLYSGYGAGWYEHEWKAYGYGFPETRDRMRAFREGVEIIHRMWTEDKPTFKGEYYSIDEPINEPKSAKPGRKIPLWIGGGGEQITLKLVAKYGDACNLGGAPEQIAHKLDVLKRHCETVGRNYDEIIRSTSSNVFLLQPGEDGESTTEKARAALNASWGDFQRDWVVGTADEVVAKLQAKTDVGIDYHLIYLPRIAYDHTMIHQVTEQVLPQLG
ncbi:MAG TPA: LLM class F420-dependent oxidoreductase [Thermomicrobiales bacterium]|jgi:F420-dependent oxidoreductase-like protein|nr:LLM class F420-dependent oxidoreductase [Thermomicrobiales bacterium]